MVIGVPTERFPGERRVALVPGVVPSLLKGGLDAVVEAGAGVEAGYPDADYVAKGAKVLSSRADVCGAADVIPQVLGVSSNDKTGEGDPSALSPRVKPHRLSAAVRSRRHASETRRDRCDGVRDRAHASRNRF